MELSKYLNFIEVLNEHLKKTPGDVDLFPALDVGENDAIDFHRANDPKGTSFNLVSIGNKKTYHGAIEIEYFNQDNPVIFLRLNGYCAVYDGKYGYINKLREMATSPIYEYNNLKVHVKYCDDLDESTVFQYNIIEENINNILILINLLREMVNTDKYDAILKSPLRDTGNV